LEPDGKAEDILLETYNKFNDLIFITGGPVTNLANFLQKNQNITIDSWYGQGGFAGDEVVPQEYRLEKFNGMNTCSTWNFGGDPNSAEFLLNTKQIKKIKLFSKNVCHGVLYNQTIHKSVKEKLSEGNNEKKGLFYLYNCMNIYLEKRIPKSFMIRWLF
jgi:inosine-uridine nucleoside N-ribohydrolase